MDVWSWLQKTAKKRGCSMNSIIRDAVIDVMKKDIGVKEISEGKG